MDIDAFLTAVFGSSKLEDLALPISIGLIVLMVLGFWLFSICGKRRTRDAIETYHASLKDHSTKLRRGMKTPSGRR
ncbi:hypothetical protein E2A64_09985 [Pseudohoeflea suaedae]|uniref:Uncharacterized protein n=1 Tax=Pseudohoeflea suaedae TaxID=877384 RepID=A0A4V3A6Z9_9HYPH|nr:hypothetical protein [Pseudohoeflea suaedae]TDH35662.1 hypothetical protein E2A64_09985 [Pseudohoeflea suaedae]